MNPPLKKKKKKHEDITLQFFIIFLFRFRVHHFTERKHSEKEKEHLIAKRKSYKSCTKWNYLSVDLKHCLAMYSECWDPLARLEWIPGIYFWTTFLTCLLADVVWMLRRVEYLGYWKNTASLPPGSPCSKGNRLVPSLKENKGFCHFLLNLNLRPPWKEISVFFCICFSRWSYLQSSTE